MLETELGKSAIRLDNTNDDAARLCAYGRMAKILDVLRGSPVAAGLLLGLLLLGVPAPVGAQDDGNLRLVRTESVNTLVEVAWAAGPRYLMMKTGTVPGNEGEYAMMPGRPQ